MAHFPLKFSFQFSADKPTLFAIPQNNQYQQITDVQLTPPDAGVQDCWVIFEKAAEANISFSYQPQEASFNFNQVIIPRSPRPPIPPSAHVNPFDNTVNSLAIKWTSQDKVTSGTDITRTLYTQLVSHLIYGRPIQGLYSYQDALKNQVVDCGGFSTLLVSLLASQGITARLVVGYLLLPSPRFHLKKMLSLPLTFENITMHVWVEVLGEYLLKSPQQLNSRLWIPLDPSIEWKRTHQMTSRQGGLGYTPADRLVISYGHDLKITYRNRGYMLPILQHPTPLT